MAENLPIDTDTIADDVQPMGKQWLTNAILDLSNDRDHQVIDPTVAYNLAHHVKPYIDRLAKEKETSAPKNTKSKHRRKVSNRPLVPKNAITELPLIEQARWIFMDRFISLERHQEILGCHFSEGDIATYTNDLIRVIAALSKIPRVALALAENRFEDLQKMFASSILLFRIPYLDNQEPINLSLLREKFSDYFYKKRELWYDKLSFSTTPILSPHWAICETQYLNCTLRSPSSKLNAYGRSWQFPPQAIRHKEVIEDVYDRIISGEALGEDLFAHKYNSCTATTYQRNNKGEDRLVHITQRQHQITIHGKRGLPHWTTSRRLWPGVVPTIVFS